MDHQNNNRNDHGDSNSDHSLEKIHKSEESMTFVLYFATPAKQTPPLALTLAIILVNTSMVTAQSDSKKYYIAY